MKLFILFLLNAMFMSFAWAHDINPKCYYYLTELVRSSNFPFTNVPRENNNLLIDTDEDDVILAQIDYSKSEMDIPNDTDDTAISGWVKYYANSRELYNVSGEIDPDNPVKLFFNKKFADLFEQCRNGR